MFLIPVPKPPKLDPSFVPKEIVVRRGETIDLSVPFIGVPKPNASWKKDENPLHEADTDIQTTDKVAQLKIPDAQRTDGGQYELTLTNEVGSEIVPIAVRVIGECTLYE